MTWKEFKEQVEAAGVQDEDDVGYIDCYSPWYSSETGSSLEVKRYEDRDGTFRFSVE